MGCQSASLSPSPLSLLQHRRERHQHHHNLSFPFPFPHFRSVPPSSPAFRAVSGAGEGLRFSQEPAPLRPPVALSGDHIFRLKEEGENDGGGDADHEDEELEDEWTRRKRAREEAKLRRTRDRWDPDWDLWEGRILEDTVPLVGFARMILHTGKYQSGERLSAEHEKVIIERLLMHHPQYDEKIGCGIDHITMGFHPDYGTSRCFFIVRKDGVTIDFSYWKCVKSLVFKKYPEYADTFILRHFRRKDI